MKNLLRIIVGISLLIADEGRIIQDFKVDIKNALSEDFPQHFEDISPTLHQVESTGGEEYNETLKCRFLLRLNLEKLITIPGVNNIYKYRLKESRIVTLVSDVMGADMVELGHATASIIIDMIEIFQLIQNNMLEIPDGHSSEILYDWFLKFVAEGWPLFSKVNKKEIFDYIDFLSNEFNSFKLDLEDNDVAKVLVKDSLEDLMGMSIKQYTMWSKRQRTQQNAFIRKQTDLLRKISRKEGVDVSFRVYNLLDQIADKIKVNSLRAGKLWQQIFDKQKC